MNYKISQQISQHLTQKRFKRLAEARKKDFALKNYYFLFDRKSWQT